MNLKRTPSWSSDEDNLAEAGNLNRQGKIAQKMRKKNKRFEQKIAEQLVFNKWNSLRPKVLVTHFA